jgi:hypothetical protein
MIFPKSYIFYIKLYPNNSNESRTLFSNSKNLPMILQNSFDNLKMVLTISLLFINLPKQFRNLPKLFGTFSIYYEQTFRVSRNIISLLHDMLITRGETLGILVNKLFDHNTSYPLSDINLIVDVL